MFKQAALAAANFHNLRQLDSHIPHSYRIEAGAISSVSVE
jgi:hypothetical protein